jgi:hypothetical protein
MRDRNDGHCSTNGTEDRSSLRQILNYEIRRHECGISFYNFPGDHFKIELDNNFIQEKIKRKLISFSQEPSRLLSKNVKMSIKTMILPVVLYGCET